MQVQREQPDGSQRSFTIPAAQAAKKGKHPSALPTSSVSGKAQDTCGLDEFPEEEMNLSLLRQVLNKVPSVKQMQAWALGGSDASGGGSGVEQRVESGGVLLRRKLDELDDLIYPLLRWLLVTNKAHLRPLRPDERFDEMGSSSMQVGQSRSKIIWQ